MVSRDGCLRSGVHRGLGGLLCSGRKKVCGNVPLGFPIGGIEVDDSSMVPVQRKPSEGNS